METLIADIRWASRSLLRQRGFTLAAIITVALGIGANTAIFSVVSSVLMRPLPFPESERLVAIWSSPAGARNRWTSAYPDYVDWKEGAKTLERVAVYNADRAILRNSEGPVALSGAVVSAELFPLLGVQPSLGRTFTEAEDKIGAGPVVVLSHDVWEKRFAASADVIGSSISLGDRNVTIVGVMPAGFKFPITSPQVDYYMPVTPAAVEKIKHRSDMFLRTVARLAPGVTVEQAQSDLAGVASRLAAIYPNTNANRTVWVNNLREDLVGDTRPALFVLFGSVALVLLVASANLANLLLAKAVGRRRETAVRAALGASRARVARQFLAESGLLALAGGTLGLLTARWVLSALLKLQPVSIQQLTDVNLDARVLLFTLGITALVTVAAGLFPVFESSQPDLVSALKEGGRGSSHGRNANRARSALVVAQVALSLMLLVGAGLLTRSFIKLRKVNPGFDASDIVVATLAPSKSRFKTVEERNLYFTRVLDSLEASPGVDSAACVAPIPFGGNESDTNFSILGRPPAIPGQEPLADYRVASSDYFRVLRIPVLRGRVFSSTDGPRSTPVVLINESFRRRFFAGVDPIGQSLIIGADPIDNPHPAPRQIVGVVADVFHSSLETPPGPEFYVPLTQDKWPSMDFVVRYKPSHTAAPVASMHNTLQSADPGEYVATPRPLAMLMDQSLRAREFTLLLLGAFAFVALLLATVGLYGVMSYLVTQRTPEIGIRMALGAQVNDVMKLVVKGGMTLAAIGLVTGLAGSFVLTQLMAGLLFGISPTDSLTFLLVSVVLLTVALVACYIPGRRAMKVDPLVALRYE